MSQDKRAHAARQWWLDSLAAAADEVRAALRDRPGERVAEWAGAEWDEKRQRLELPFWDETYAVLWPDVTVVDASGQPAREITSLIILSYLQRADGTLLTGRWVSFRELPDGAFYHQAFNSYTGYPLARAIGNAVERLKRAATALGGQPDPVGDVGFRFRALPRVWLAVAYWQGDEELPAQVRILFDAAAGHYLDAAGLAGIGAQLTGRLLRLLRES